MRSVLVGLMLVGFFSAVIRGETKRLETVPSVDLKRYQGTWYEIARLPNRFQDQCVGNVSASYQLRQDGRITVVNQCKLKDGTTDRAEGIARLADKDGPTSKLKVRFAPAYLSFLPFVWGDYWIMDLAPDYGYVLIGEPSRKYLWILARSPKMPDETYARLIEKARGQGFAVERLVRTAQE